MAGVNSLCTDADASSSRGLFGAEPIAKVVGVSLCLYNLRRFIGSGSHLWCTKKLSPKEAGHRKVGIGHQLSKMAGAGRLKKKK